LLMVPYWAFSYDLTYDRQQWLADRFAQESMYDDQHDCCCRQQ